MPLIRLEKVLLPPLLGVLPPWQVMVNVSVMTCVLEEATDRDIQEMTALMNDGRHPVDDA